jgi:integrase family protein
MEDTSRGTIRAKEIRSKKDSYFRRKERFLRPSYNAKTANKKAKGRHKKQNLLLMQDNFLLTKEYVDLKLKERWSPEQISNILRTKDILLYASHKAIYKYIYLSNQERYLRRKGKKRCPTWRFKQSRINQDKRNISKRPEEINNLSRFGDLEGDTIFGKDTKDRLLTHVDRKTGLVAISIIKSYDAREIEKDRKDILNKLN